MLADQSGLVANIYHVEYPVTVADVADIVTYGCPAPTKLVVRAPAAAVRDYVPSGVHHSRRRDLRLAGQLAGFHIVHDDSRVNFSSEVLPI